MNFLKDLKEYDKDNIPVSHFCRVCTVGCFVKLWLMYFNGVVLWQAQVMQKIRSEYMTNPDFDPTKVAKASSAAEGLCKWITAMEVYDRVAKVGRPSSVSHTK